MEPVTIVIAAALLAAVVEGVKRTVDAWARRRAPHADPPDTDLYAPALTIVLGVVAGAAGVIDDVGWIGGLLAALTASGLYSGAKATARAAR